MYLELHTKKNEILLVNSFNIVYISPIKDGTCIAFSDMFDISVKENYDYLSNLLINIKE